jgi:hypothetical protein
MQEPRAKGKQENIDRWLALRTFYWAMKTISS